jgi:hypothetical protein
MATIDEVEMNVTLRQLRVFIEVARLSSFSRAGDEIAHAVRGQPVRA